MNDDGDLTVDRLIAHPFDGTTFGTAIRRHFPLLDGRNGREQWVERLHSDVEYYNAFPPSRRWALDKLCVSIFRRMKQQYHKAEANRDRELAGAHKSAVTSDDDHHARMTDWHAWRLYRDKLDCERKPFMPLREWIAAGRPSGDIAYDDAPETPSDTIQAVRDAVRLAPRRRKSTPSGAL